jgi:hypothetical protein
MARRVRDVTSIRWRPTLVRHGLMAICPDLVGRGRSERLRDRTEYTLPQYAMDLTALIGQLGLRPRVGPDRRGANRYGLKPARWVRLPPQSRRGRD